MGVGMRVPVVPSLLDFEIRNFPIYFLVEKCFLISFYNEISQLLAPLKNPFINPWKNPLLPPPQNKSFDVRGLGYILFQTPLRTFF